MKNGICVCTAVAGNYLAYARVLTDSIRRFHPAVPLYVLLAGTLPPGETLNGGPTHVLPLEDLRIPGLPGLLLRYDRKQVLAAAKPSLLRHMLELGYETVVYLDADMLVTASLQPVFETVAAHAMTLTPHIGPDFAGSERTDLERALLFAGMYNGGFVGVTGHDESRRFLVWWEQRLRTHCLEAVAAGLHYDQRWLDMAPALVTDLHLLRDPGVNVAYWNLPDLDLRPAPDGLSVNGTPLRVFHFSGFRPSLPRQVTLYVPDLRVDDLGPAAELFRRYEALLREAGWEESAGSPWPWDGWRQFLRRVFRLPRTIAALLRGEA